MSKKKKEKAPGERNIVAKHAHKYNRAATHRDRKNDYKRSEKHKGSDNSSFHSDVRTIIKECC